MSPPARAALRSAARNADWAGAGVRGGPESSRDEDHAARSLSTPRRRHGMGSSIVLPLILGAGLGLVGGLLLGWFLKGGVGRSEIIRARGEAQEIIKQTRREAENQKRQAKFQAGGEWLKKKTRLEQDLRNKSRESQTLQRSLEEREVSLADRDQRLRVREQELDARDQQMRTGQSETTRERERTRRLTDELNDQLGKISGMTGEDARQMLLTNMRQEVRFEAGKMIREAREEAQQKAESEAGKIVTLAIERTASEWCAERSVTTFPIANEKLKGRIIGHEGKNIRSFEKLTGVQLLMDDQPGAVVLSCFNPIRREIARLTLERLLKDGNISPRRIEELVAKFQRRGGGRGGWVGRRGP